MCHTSPHLAQVYGVEGFPRLWAEWVAAYLDYWARWEAGHPTTLPRGGDICSEEVHKVSCPTLVIHGAKDAMVAEEHVHFLHETIPFAQKFIFEEGKHNLHMKYRDEFNKMVTEFLKQ